MIFVQPGEDKAVNLYSVTMSAAEVSTVSEYIAAAFHVDFSIKKVESLDEQVAQIAPVLLGTFPRGPEPASGGSGTTYLRRSPEST